jgi:hypothetical protein
MQPTEHSATEGNGACYISGYVAAEILQSEGAYTACVRFIKHQLIAIA